MVLIFSAFSTEWDKFLASKKSLAIKMTRFYSRIVDGPSDGQLTLLWANFSPRFPIEYGNAAVN